MYCLGQYSLQKVVTSGCSSIQVAGDNDVRFVQSGVHIKETILALNTKLDIQEEVNILISSINHFSQ